MTFECKSSNPQYHTSLIALINSAMECSSLKLVALAADKFIAGVAKDAKDFCLLRVGDKRSVPLSMQVSCKITADNHHE